MKLSEYARLHGLAYETARRQFKKGLITGAYQMSSGTIIVPDQVDELIIRGNKEQLAMIHNFCTSQKWLIILKQRDLLELK